MCLSFFLFFFALKKLNSIFPVEATGKTRSFFATDEMFDWLYLETLLIKSLLSMRSFFPSALLRLELAARRDGASIW